jgi:hypothetical protein
MDVSPAGKTHRFATTQERDLDGRSGRGWIWAGRWSVEAACRGQRTEGSGESTKMEMEMEMQSPDADDARGETGG